MTQSKTKNKIFLSAYQTFNIPNGFSLQLVENIKDIQDNTVDEIFIKDIIGIYDDTAIVDFIQKIIDKLKPNGILYIQDIDIEQFCLYIANKAIHLSDKELLYKHRNNIFSISNILKILQAIDTISIQQINFINGYEFYFMVIKNED